MDEYLFILLAKLKADRLNAARAQRNAAAGQQDLFEGSEIPTTHRPPHRSIRARWFCEPDWPVRS
jgi:hypothetical protein